MLASSRKPCDAARLPGGRERPPYNTRQTGGGTGNGRPPAPGQRGDPCVGPPSGLTCGCRFCIAARPRAQCRAGDFARREGSRRPGRVLSKLGAAPLSRLTPTAPLTGEPFRRQSPKSPPARGGGCAARCRRRGALPPCPTGILQNPTGPCPASAGDDAGIVPETLRCRKASRRA